MALVPAPNTPTTAVARKLRRLGLKQGPTKDFRVLGHYVKGEREHTYVDLQNAEARQLVADRADELEEWLTEGPFPFKVSIRYSDTGQPWPHIHNGAAERIREARPTAEDVAEEPTPAAAEEPAAPADVDAPAEGAEVPELDDEPAPAEEAEVSAAPADVDVPAEEDDVPDSPEEYWERREASARHRRQAAALLWSTKQAETIRAAVAGHLFRDDAADAYRRSADRTKTGRRVSGSFLVPLGEAGFLTMGEPGPDGRRLVEATADARQALKVWDLCKPKPAERNHKQERMPLAPLLGGEEATRRHEELLADDERRSRARAVWLASYREERAAEEREARLRDAWARVEGIRNPLSKRPTGWVPTDEQVAEHGLPADVVAELQAEAAGSAGGSASAQVA